jgi:predicted nucleic acid-binding protein
MKRLVLDAGPLIALVSKKDNYHQSAKRGFRQISREFGEVLTPLPVLFEVYKFVSRNQSPKAAQFLLNLLQEETVVIPISFGDFSILAELVLATNNWSGTLEDASVIVIAQQEQAQIWTIDHKDLGYFNNVEFWTPF